MIKINLHDYRLELRHVAIQKLVVKAAGIILGAVVLTLGYWVVQQVQLDQMQADILELEKQVKALDGPVKAVQKMQAKKRRAKQIMEGISMLRLGQMPATRILEDISMNIPSEIWLTGLEQRTLEQLVRKKIPVIFIGDPEKIKPKKKKKKKKKKKEELPDFLEIKGRVFGSYGDRVLAGYMKQLEQVPYFKEVFLYQTKYVRLGTYPVREFTIYCYMPKPEPKKKGKA